MSSHKGILAGTLSTDRRGSSWKQNQTLECYRDQGSAGDPNYSKGGVGVNINRERFNDWGGFKGVENSRRWRQQQQAQVNKSAAEAATTTKAAEEVIGRCSGSCRRWRTGSSVRPFTARGR